MFDLKDISLLPFCLDCVHVCKGDEQQLVPRDWWVWSDCCLRIGRAADITPFKPQLPFSTISNNWSQYLVLCFAMSSSFLPLEQKYLDKLVLGISNSVFDIVSIVLTWLSAPESSHFVFLFSNCYFEFRFILCSWPFLWVGRVEESNKNAIVSPRQRHNNLPWSVIVFPH